MGVVIKAVVDGFRRGGIAHRARGTYYEDGHFTDTELELLRAEPLLLITEQAEFAQGADEDAQLLQQMGDTIAHLEHSLEQARAGLKTASADVVGLLDGQKRLPGLVLDAIRLLEPAPVDGVITINEDALVEIIGQCLKEIRSDASQSALENSGGDDASSTSASVSPVAAPPGADTPVKVEKPTGKRGSEKKGAGE